MRKIPHVFLTLRISSIDLPVALCVEGNHIIGLTRRAIDARGANRHACHSQPDDLRALLEQAINFADWHVTFYNVAIHDGPMAGLEISRYLKADLDGSHVLNIFHRRIKSVLLDILDPVAAAASGGGTINCDGDLV